MRIFITFFLFLNFSLASVLGINEAFKLNINSDENAIYMNFDIADDIYIYQNSIKIKLNDKDITNLLNFPSYVLLKGEKRYYKNISLYITNFLIKNEFKENKAYKLEVNYQGCSNGGYCYRPVKKIYELSLNENIYNISEIKEEIHKKNENKIEKNSFFDNKNFIIVIFSFFVYGLLLCLSPCSLPMIPILSSLILANKQDNISKKRAFFLSLVYVFFMSLAYAFAGILTSLLGLSFQAFLQKPIVLISFAIFFVFLAFCCFGFFSLKMPNKIQNLIHKKTKGGSFIAVAIMGFLSVLIIGPCMVAPLSAALLYIAHSADFILGGFALFALGFGTGIPLLFVGLGFSFIKPGAWLKKINIFFGFLMLYMAIWLLSNFINQAHSFIAYGVLSVFFVSFMGLFESAKSNINKFFKAILIIILSLGLLVFFKGLFEILDFNLQISSKKEDSLNFKHINSLSEIEKVIQNSKKPVLLDFTASWCVNCKLLDNTTFKDENVKKSLKDYELIKVDVSDTSKEQVEIMKRFNVFAPPVLIFFNNGDKKAQIIGYTNSDDLLKTIQDVF